MSNQVHQLSRAVIAIIMVLTFSAMSFAGSPQNNEKTKSSQSPQELTLAEYSQNEALSLDQRVLATAALGEFYGANAVIAVGRASRSSHKELRRAAIQAASKWQGKAKWDVVSPLLNDSNYLVKQEAVRTLVVLWPQLSQAYIDVLGPAVDYHLTNLPTDLEGDLERAWIYRLQGNDSNSEPLYTKMHARYSDPRVSLVNAEYLKDRDKNQQAISLLETSLIEYPNYAATYYSLGLAYYRASRSEEAITQLRRSYEIEPSNTKFGYAYASLLGVAKPIEAVNVFKDIYARNQQPTYLYAWCNALLSAEQNAESCLQNLEKVAPKDVVVELKQRY
ncbi:hypothetical protein KP803_09310 [Vibrio sp. ZSDE26]|uniref:Tetratricopeptide repeat protein n=1 Tax=Vibrio amylolyticus TaxID=2847292 RepID=A0A9X1XM79_9VIBR|nr:hypothetical protein [Vibrio amylolyticus]MCK6263470.1 hypothetical protein [Vibrio amylolyticus]